METDMQLHTPPAGEVAVSFIVIVLNGMPLIELVLANLYDHAHEIIIVEGAVTECLFAANPDGSSTDGTVEAIRAFPDPERKIRLVQGIWPEKCEMQNKALEQVTGNYVWLVDSDELYRHGDIEAVVQMLRDDPDITQVNFILDNFWKGFDYIFVSPVFFAEPTQCRRVFKYVPGSRFSTHRPPTLYWPGSSVSTEQQKLVSGTTMRNLGIWPYHYSYVFDSQVRQKIELYRRYGWDKSWNVDMQSWYRDFYQQWTPENAQELEKRYPVWTGDPQSYTVPFPGDHPEVVEEYLAKHPRSAIPDLPMHHVIQAVQEVLYFFLLERRLLALETGTIRSYDEHHESTRHIAQTLGNRGKLVSVDNSKESIRISRDICRNAPNVKWVLSDSLAFLAREPKPRYHFVLLDSVNDAEYIFQEFVLVAPLVQEGGILMVDDAGIHPGGQKFDRSKAQKGHKVWAFLRACRADYAVLETPCGHGTQLKIVFTKANRDRILSSLAEIRAKPDQIEASDRPSRPVRNKPKIAAHHVPSGTQVSESSDFSRAIEDLVAVHRPQRIIETGTYLGTGTTQTIAAALAKQGDPETQFYTIEVNPANYRQAIGNLSKNRLLRHVKPMLGLSVPRAMLPSLAEIKKTAIEDIADLDVFVDHEEADRVLTYHAETNFQDLPDDLLGACLDEFDNKPDFVLLDSGGHMGFVEFSYLVSRLAAPCLVALDDVHHVKHYKNLQWIKKDARFRILRESDEKFGFCIAAFTPGTKANDPPVKRILWVRTDSIGDNVLAMSMLAPLRANHPQAQIAVVCQEHIAELYSGGTGVHTVIPFNREALVHDNAHQRRIVKKIQAFRPDIVYNSVYSRDQVSDFLTLSSRAPRRIGLEGDFCNISAEDKAHNDVFYTRLIPSQGFWKPELERHRDFLRDLGMEADGLAPHLEVDAEDLAFADAVLAEHGLDPARTIALFCGVQNDVRLYGHYGIALEPICREHGLAVVALGSSQDTRINQDNLDRCRTATLNLSGSTTLKQSMALLRRCRLAVGAETGLAHMACAVSTPNVILLGGGHFGRFMPYSPLTTVVSLPLDCYWCNWHCRYERAHCVADVSPEVLNRAIRQALATSADRPRAFFQEESSWPWREGLPRWLSPDRVLAGPPSGERKWPDSGQSSPPNPVLRTSEARHAPDEAAGTEPEMISGPLLGTSPSQLFGMKHATHHIITRDTSMPNEFPASQALPANIPTIHMVTPCYKAAATIGETIQSILKQQGEFRLRYHIQDGASDDGTLEQIKAFEQALTSGTANVGCREVLLTWDSAPDTGMYDAIAKGFARLDPPAGDFMTWLNADDLLLPGALDRVAHLAISRPDVVWIGGARHLVDEAGRLIEHDPDTIFPQEIIAQGLCDGIHWQFVQQEGLFWRASLYAAVGGLDTSLRWAGDWDLWRRMAAHAPRHALPVALGAFRRHQGQISADLTAYFAEIDAKVPRPVRARLARLLADKVSTLEAPTLTDPLGNAPRTTNRPKSPRARTKPF